MNSMHQASTDQVWRWLSEVPDPEIPVISVTELGIVRDVAWHDDTLVVTVTPTYSGCPATAVINIDIEQALHAHGLKKVRLLGPRIGLVRRRARSYVLTGLRRPWTEPRSMAASPHALSV